MPTNSENPNTRTFRNISPDEARAARGRQRLALLESIASIADSLNVLRQLNNQRRKHFSLPHDDRLAEWLATDARIGAEEGLENEAWTCGQINDVAKALLVTVISAKCRLESVTNWPEYTNGRADTLPSNGESLDRQSVAPCLDLAVAAGIRRELWDEECDNWITLPADLPTANYVALRVSGESMEPVLHPGDVILVRVQARFESGSIVVARAADEGFVVKRVRQVTRGFVQLAPINPAYPMLNLPLAETPVLGTVVLKWCGHNDKE